MEHHRSGGAVHTVGPTHPITKCRCPELRLVTGNGDRWLLAHDPLDAEVLARYHDCGHILRHNARLGLLGATQSAQALGHSFDGLALALATATRPTEAPCSNGSRPSGAR